MAAGRHGECVLDAAPGRRGVKQVVLRGGRPTLVDIPAPSPEPGRLLVANAASLISSGTERSAVSASGGSLPMRAIRNPDLVRMTLRHAREHGVRQTIETVRTAVADDTVLGYSSAGVVLHTGEIADFAVGDRVACAGAGQANHAEVVSVPGNLAAKVPDGVSLRDAAFTTLGAIALQGVRRAGPSLGERVVVVGLGLLGLLSVQILRAAGCQVVGVEPAASRRALAADLGAEVVWEPGEAVAAVREWSQGVGADAVVITASTTSDVPVNDAVEMTRRKGRVVPVGDVGLGLERGGLYQREADVLISTSYGPGRYDPLYEEAGLDYPIAYVRWTENRNMEAFLRLVATGAVRVEPLVELELSADRAAEAYDALNGERPPLAAVLTYPDGPRDLADRGESVDLGAARPGPGQLGVAVIGPGSFVRAVHVPTLKGDPAARIVSVVSRRGTNASDVARSVGGAEASTDWRAAIARDDVDLVVVGTRHDTHAEIAAAALRAGKAVFVEKPLGLSREQIDDVWAAAQDNPRLAIGFNRPFAELSQRLHDEVASAVGPLHVIYRVNAPLPRDHWLNDPRVGGGRIQGEACHMLDYANWLCGEPIRVTAAAIPAPTGVDAVESASITVSYADGSVATVHYSGLGAAGLPKERIEVLRGGRAWVLEDFRTLVSYDGPGAQTTESRRQDKGHAALLGGVMDACRSGRSLRPGIEAAYLAQALALGALESIASGQTVAVARPGAGA
jgi:predicted dehydrogenase/threonine dehydrogenase-like Zn-dependent dehydrogenase